MTEHFASGDPEHLAPSTAHATEGGHSAHGPGAWYYLTIVNDVFTMTLVVRSFASSETERLFATGKSRRIPSEIRVRAVMRLTQLHAATAIEDLRSPQSNRLEALKGDRKGEWSIRINDQWRICFRFERGDALDVEIVDYH